MIKFIASLLHVYTSSKGKDDAIMSEHELKVAKKDPKIRANVL